VEEVHVIINGRALDATPTPEGNIVGSKRQANYATTLLLFHAGAPPRFCCRRLFRFGGRLGPGSGLGLLPSLNQLVTSKLIHRFLLFIIVIIIRNVVVVLVPKSGRAFVSLNHPLTSWASSRSGTGSTASFFGTLPRSCALWNGTGWSLELYLGEVRSLATNGVRDRHPLLSEGSLCSSGYFLQNALVLVATNAEFNQGIPLILR